MQWWGAMMKGKERSHILVSKIFPNVLKICLSYAHNRFKMCWRYAKDILMICPIYVKDIVKIYSIHAQDMAKLCWRYGKTVLEICQRYAHNMLKISSRYSKYKSLIFPIYAHDMSKIYQSNLDIPWRGFGLGLTGLGLHNWAALVNGWLEWRERVGRERERERRSIIVKTLAAQM